MKTIAATAILCGAAALAGGAWAEDTAVEAGPMLTCGVPVAWDATEADLKTTFGADKVEYRDLGGPEGEELPGTLVNGDDPRRRLEVVWADAAARAKPEMLRLLSLFDERAEATVAPDWTMPSGLKVGLTLSEVEAINGRPFRLSGFGWDYGGMVLDWEGGALEAGRETCEIAVMFEPRAAFGESATGDIALASDDPALRAADPAVMMMMLTYRRAEEGGE